MANATVESLRDCLCAESTLLTSRFRALFSLKHLAQTTDGPEAAAAIDAIAAAFSSPSALLKHELAYCLGQTGKDAAIKPLRDVLSDVKEDAMCRHEAAEALGALGNAASLELLKEIRDRDGEEVVVKETCEIAIDRIVWQNSEARKQEKLRQRYLHIQLVDIIVSSLLTLCAVTLHPSILPHRKPSPKSLSMSWKRR
jgi:deoxyhypusine monooxygenase